MSAIYVHSVAQCPTYENLWTRGQTISSDWSGEQSPLVPQFLCAIDQTHFHFLAGDQGPPLNHPQASTGKFQPELWKYDVAEFFLAAPDRSSYLEFNLSPNGAWWSAFFEKPHAKIDQAPLQAVISHGELTKLGWQARTSIPLDQLGLAKGSLLNVTFILGSPKQRFFTSTPLGPGPPNFHQPAHFLPMSLSSPR